ncbi:hypothetical protein Q4489_02565 [Thalassotalea sp. 1_MG-2023]|uniref:hypothetical protein n=1 Tax=Thalassotalea sp. 1_MG-2023 TaxID=3062680 RepID=UPI0026E22010|nr:hypothetical protein [Thalassotalea sp. 1_MG-2023]MDO6425873.1 hypothetical protein [Thalassotalea sp. 1_MG-2023]
MKAKQFTYALLLLIHSFFSCDSAPFYPPDQEHASYSHLQHIEGLELEEKLSPDLEGEHEIHVHLSCLSGYGAGVAFTGCLETTQTQLIPTYTSLYYSPPLPPPNSHALIIRAC